MSTAGKASSVADYDVAYYLKREATPTLAAEIRTVTKLLDPRGGSCSAAVRPL